MVAELLTDSAPLLVLDPFEGEQDCMSLRACANPSTWAVVCLASGCWGSVCDEHMRESQRLIEVNMRNGVRCTACDRVTEGRSIYRFDPIISPVGDKLW